MQNKKGLYIPQLEKDACGIGMITNLNGNKSHKIVEEALTMLHNMEHRGACGYEENTGDGAGILLQTPHKFFAKKAREIGFELPEFGKYGVGTVFFPKDRVLRTQCRVLFNDYIDELGFELLDYRKIPTDNEELGNSAVKVEPRMEHVFVKPKTEMDRKQLERRLFVLRKFATHNIHITFPQAKDNFYITSFSYKTVVYKGQFTTGQVRPYFPDLQDELFESAIALVHSRFSTNTVPKWKLAQPFRYIAHNGEINTINGNVNWWKAKEHLLKTNLFSEDELEKLKPIIGIGHSDSGSFDNALEFLVLSGRTLPHALMMMVPEAWQHNDQMANYKKAFYEYHKTMMEAWDGPASICFTDGILVGATLDRNGLRPSRYCLTDDNTLYLASEAGALPIDQSTIVLKGRLQPGKMLIADLEENRIIGDEELKRIVCQRGPYRDWLENNRLKIDDLKINTDSIKEENKVTLVQKQNLFGYSREDLKMIIAPMVQEGKDPIGSMGADWPLAVLSQHSQHLANYFKQLFAQVTNPPIDPIRERSVMSLFTMLGGSGNILEQSENHAKFIHLDSPILTNDHLQKLKNLSHPDFKTGQIDIVFKADNQEGRLRAALDAICAEAEDLTRNGVNILILSDKNVSQEFAPIPALMATGAIHHHLIETGLRMKTSLVIESGEVRETHHFATLIGYGANAVNAYVAYETISQLKEKGIFHEQLNGKTTQDPFKIYNKAIGKGLLKIMSKIGISTVQSYHGAQVFEILGLSEEVVEKCFKSSVSRIQGLSFNDLAKEVLMKHKIAFPKIKGTKPKLEMGGIYQWKRDGEAHLLNPKTIHLLQYATRLGDYPTFKKYSKAVNEQSEKVMTLRGLLTFRKGKSVPIDEVESVEDILPRFATGAMSFGSISHEAHTTLAIAMNRIGGKSNSGEGGEDESRFIKKENGDWERSAIKQIASGRFGVTSHYLANATELQIKMAQGAKPGEGGQLPGHKVNDWIGRVRHSTPGVGLISPPPHHDIYSIEDLAQLIFDLKNANSSARINVKLVSKAGVGIIASGVAKAHADAILISGDNGGTGASPLSSIRHAGLPWELGLAESHQTLVKNRLRDRVTLQTDGKILTGRDLAMAALLGAEEWGVATAALIVEGCIMMRKCHANTCPVGIATQDPELRKRFTGKPEHVINFFTFLAEELREIMAELGYRTVNEMVGKVEMLKAKKGITHWKLKHIDLSPILYKEPADEKIGQYKQIAQDHGISNVLDKKLIRYARPALDSGQSIETTFPIINTDRAVGAMLSHEISKKYGGKGLPDGTIRFRFRGSAGQSFGAFTAKGVEFTLEGEANDYFGKGLSGAVLIASPDRDATFEPHKNIIIGNVAFYGATSGEAYIKGMAGERFCVRNSGVRAVVEGTGDHACEYMTGGRVIILGETGKNFGAGMSGGIAYIFDKNNSFEGKVNPEMIDLDPMEKEDVELVRTMVRNHFTYTASKHALNILNDWDNAKKHFVKVMPRDYKRALEEKKKRIKAKKTTVETVV
ncbi:glutamate synthase large subunit [Saprospiraceae bacterium]|jgi:glutamate synthase (NADPH/NADH) large chain|nr:glutamate synthase large subunit [Bacteroidota bacterium]MDB4727173.1 glutamate synthase large subunit [Saprospiraceae bacterium]